MKLILDNLKIEFESHSEIQDFWNIIMFALDLHNERIKKGESCMNEDELKLAQKLEVITNRAWLY